MTGVTRKLFREAMRLTAAERAALVEELLGSLDKPDTALDELWAKEAEDRLSAFRATTSTNGLDSAPNFAIKYSKRSNE